MLENLIFIFFAVNYAKCESTIQFLEYVQTGNFSGVEGMLYATEDLDNLLTYRDDSVALEEPNALELAVRHRHQNIIQLLLAAGADPVSLNDYGTSALHDAAGSSLADIFEILLINCDEKCLETRNIHGETVLMVAVKTRRIQNIYSLLIKNANVHDINPLTNKSIVRESIREEETAYIFEMLAERGASMGVKNEYGRSYAMVAIMNKQVRILKIFLKQGGDPNAISEESDGRVTALHYAVEFDILKAVEILAKWEGILLDVKDARGRTPAMAAFFDGKYDILKVILENGGDQHLEGEQFGGRTTYLHVIVQEGDLERVRTFASCKNMLLDAKDFRGKTVAMAAILNNRNDILKVILENGADPNVKSTEYHGFSTSLHLAVHCGNLEAVKFLLDIRGILRDEIDMHGRTPSMIAILLNRSDILNIIVGKGINPNVKSGESDGGSTALHLAARGGNVGMVKTLLNIRGILVDEKNLQGRTPAMLAVVNRNHKILKEFLLKGADLNIKSEETDGCTALHLAILGGDLASVNLLLGTDAVDIKIKNKDDKTPMDLADLSRSKEIIAALVAYKRKNSLLSRILHGIGVE